MHGERPRVASGDPWSGHWRYRVDPNFTGTPFTLTTPPNTTEPLAVEDPAGNNLTTAAEPPIAIVLSTGGNDADGQNAVYDGKYAAGLFGPTFNDMTVWLSRPLIFNRMIMAGKLP